ncbi:hypothetical protein LTS10_000816 [Elasticomyces elasticus]|nr:hypothetical protein LTS10_000816 [Elasticomyces elasticus]
MAAATSRSSLAEFPGELLVSIAELLDIVDLPKFARTCRKFDSIVHEHKNSITYFAIERQYHRLSEQAHELNFTGLDLVTALRKFSKVQATEATTIRLDRDFVSRCFVALYQGSNRSTRYSNYSPKSMWSLVWTTTGQMAPPHMPTIPQAEIDRVALAKAELWPANVVFNDYRPDAMFIHYHDRTLLEPRIDEERQRLRGQIDELDLRDMPVLAALRRFAAAQVRIPATRLHQEFAAQCFTHFYRRSNYSARYSQSELFALLWTTFPTSQLRLEYIPWYLRAEVAQVRLAAEVMPFWPSDIAFTNDDRDVEYVALNMLDADGLGLPSAGLSRNMVYACRGKSADGELRYAFQKTLATDESDPGARRFMQARLLERTTILPLDMFIGCQMDELRGWHDRQTVRLVPSLGRTADETA